MLQVILKDLDKFSSTMLGDFILTFIFGIVGCIFYKYYMQFESKNIEIMNLLHQNYKKHIKVTITIIGIYFMCIWTLLCGSNTEGIIKLLLSNAVFLIVMIVNDDESFRRLKNIIEVKKAMIFNGWLGFSVTAMNFMLCGLIKNHYLISFWPNPWKMIIVTEFQLILDIIIAPSAIILCAEFFNYFLLYISIRIGFIDIHKID